MLGGVYDCRNLLLLMFPGTEGCEPGVTKLMMEMGKGMILVYCFVRQVKRYIPRYDYLAWLGSQKDLTEVEI